MGLSFLKQIFKGSRCGCKKYTKRKLKTRKNYRGGYKASKSQKNTSQIRLSSPSKKINK